MSMRKTHIVIEGIDGSGKSSLATILGDRLNSNGLGTRIIPWFKDKGFREIANIFNLSGAMTPEVLASIHSTYTLTAYREAEADSCVSVVIWDRYIYSSYCSTVLRGMKRTVARDMLEGFQRPDLVIALKSDPRLCYDRVKSRGGVTFFEAGLDRIYRAERLSEALEAFNTGQVDENLVQASFVDIMSGWNELLVEALPDDALVIEDFDLSNADGIDHVVSLAERAVR